MDKLQSYTAPSGASIYTEDSKNLADALSGYSKVFHATDLQRISNSFNSLSDDDLAWLAEVQAKLGIKESLEERICNAVELNQEFLSELTTFIPSVHQDGQLSGNALGSQPISARVRVLPWAVAREWGNDPGLIAERNEAFVPILEAVKSRFPDFSGAKILVPGSGCGRLLYELAALGHKPTGIEFDALKLLSTAYLFQGNKSVIKPFALETCNRLHAGDNTREVSVPDIEIDAKILSNITVDGNEFFESTSGTANHEYDCIVSSFFIDSITDVEKYVAEFARLLKPGGVWINVGPLNFHYPSERIAPQTPRRELSVEGLIGLIQKSGFRIDEQRMVKTTYLGNRKSMMQTKYGCVFSVATLS